MSLVEKEITQKNIEQAHNHTEFERRREIEQKLVPSNPRVFETFFKQKSVPIEQLYLSNPDDEFSLRLRRIEREDRVVYKATQKDRGSVHHNALERTEIDTEISKETYNYYASLHLPRVQKRRFDIADGVSVDFFDDENIPVLIEVEHPDSSERAARIAILETCTHTQLHDHSDDFDFTNEAIAHKHTPEYDTHTPESLDAFSAQVAKEMVARHVAGKDWVIAGLTGMSGSGKTTVTRAIQSHIVEAFGESYRPVVISTDDYHFGKKKLEEKYGAPYSEWDDPKTYDTKQLARDLQALSKGEYIAHRHFDFEAEEPINDTVVTPSPFIIVEGLYAGSADLREVRDLHFELPTSVATSIGRDVRRLVIEGRANRVFPTPEDRLRYQIETALPLFLTREKPRPNSFSACARPLATRAFMLTQLKESLESQK